MVGQGTTTRTTTRAANTANVAQRLNNAANGLQTTSEPGKPQTIKELIQSMRGEIAKVLPKHVTAEKLARVMQTSLRTTPKLAECTPTSFLAAMMASAQLGLMPGPTQECYLIPFKRWDATTRTSIPEVQFIVGYRGLINLARRSGEIKTIQARVVHEGDQFEFEYGFDEKLKHVPALSGRGKPTYVYAYAILNDGGRQVEVMSVDEINQIRDMSKSAKNREGQYVGPWADHWEEMARKTVIRRLCKYLPMSVDLLSKAEAADGTVKNEVNYDDMSEVPPVAQDYIDGEYQVVDGDQGEDEGYAGDATPEDRQKAEALSDDIRNLFPGSTEV